MPNANIPLRNVYGNLSAIALVSSLAGLVLTADTKTFSSRPSTYTIARTPDLLPGTLDLLKVPR